MVVGSVVFFPTERFFARCAFFLTRCGRDNFLTDAGWLTAGRIALFAMLSCLTSLRERWKIVAFCRFCRLSSL